MRRFDFVFLVSCVVVILTSSLSAEARDRFDRRIAIIGAGAAGLTAALTLSDLGYRDVTVFESEAQVGGKVRSLAIEDRVYELGAAFLLPDFNTVFELADRFGVPYGDSGLAHLVVDSGGQTHNMMDFPSDIFGAGTIFRSLIRFDFFRFFHPHAFRESFAEAPRELNVNFDIFARQHGFEALALSAAPMLVGCGYGYMDRVPALYLTRLMDSFVPVFRQARLSPHSMRFPNFVGVFPYGYQSLWQEMARHLNVQLGSPVTIVVRNNSDAGDDLEINVTAGGVTSVFDALVISNPLDKALGFLDASAEEQDLFSRIRYFPYTVTIFRGENLKHSAMTFLDANTTSATIGRMTGLYNQYADQEIWTAGQIGSTSMDHAALSRMLRDDVKSLGGGVRDILIQQTWSHFPHVTTTDLDDGFYQRLDKLQGVSGTFYIGGIMNFDSVEHTVKFARDLMRREF